METLFALSGSTSLWPVCNFKYEGIRAPVNRVIDQVSNMLYLILSSQFPNLPLSPTIASILHLIEHIKPKLDFKMVKWNRPTFNEFKLNVDGCSKGNHGSAGGGVLRDYAGHLLMAFSAYFGCCSNNYADSQALKIGLNWCLDHGFSEVNIESDSLLVIQMIKGEIKPFWHIKEDIRQIQAMRTLGHFTFTISSEKVTPWLTCLLTLRSIAK
ncbi:hypothetical protein RND71_028721 [Anisodus tanguticus]|uniref:RNase H type-1 domain-containing protein n=1 Tax=Anisodus tanguticus TaxID=243964 RepID=A0AAE1RK63_9SOLA|nr:hypothetical protein RND71_028721 [Anisodus tanguticus]